LAVTQIERRTLAGEASRRRKILMNHDTTLVNISIY
jgi:hypothetical protein